MKCRCPACGRSTEIEPALLDFFSRCTRCGIILRPCVQSTYGDEQGDSLVAKIVPIGRVRESPAPMNGQIAELLSRPAPIRATAAVQASAAIQTVVAVQTVPPMKPVPAVIAANTEHPPTALPERVRRRFALRERHQTLGMVGIFGLGMMALVAVGALALKSRNLFLRATRAQADVVRTDSAP